MDKLVREGLNFERTHNPLETMDIGQKGKRVLELMRKISKELGIGETPITADIKKEWALAQWEVGSNRIVLFQVPEDRQMDYINLYGDTLIMYHKVGILGGPENCDIRSYKEWDTIEEWKQKIEWPIKESQNFERGKDPIKSMGIGHRFGFTSGLKDLSSNNGKAGLYITPQFAELILDNSPENIDILKYPLVLNLEAKMD